MPKHIPGNPNIIIQNVAGAAGLIGTNQVYNIAKPDGLTLGAIYPALYFEQLVKRPEVKFDWNKFIWIGSTSELATVSCTCAPTRRTKPSKIFAPRRRRRSAAPPASHRPPITCRNSWKKPSAPSSKSSQVMSPGRISTSPSSAAKFSAAPLPINAYFAREPFITWRKKNFVRVLYQTGSKRDPRLKDVPLFNELMDKYKTAGKRPALGESRPGRR